MHNTSNHSTTRFKPRIHMVRVVRGLIGIPGPREEKKYLELSWMELGLKFLNIPHCS
jgi:hypothetical protein